MDKYVSHFPMALQEDQVNRIIRGFIARLEQEIPVQEVILFGSYAEGTVTEDSDVDLLVVADTDLPPRERFCAVRRLHTALVSRQMSS